MVEWAQLRAYDPPYGLKRGRWYGVVARTNDGLVQVKGRIGRRDVVVALHQAQIRIIAHEPMAVTRVAVAPGTPGDLTRVTYYGVCPRNHRIPMLGLAALQAGCPVCAITYPVEDEWVYERNPGGRRGQAV